LFWFQVAALHREFKPHLGFGSFTFRVGKFGDERRFIAPLPPDLRRLNVKNAEAGQ
jgi:hypothetical protein